MKLTVAVLGTEVLAVTVGRTREPAGDAGVEADLHSHTDIPFGYVPATVEFDKPQP